MRKNLRSGEKKDRDNKAEKEKEKRKLMSVLNHHLVNEERK